MNFLKRTLFKTQVRIEKIFIKTKNLTHADYYRALRDIFRRLPDIVHLKNLVFFSSIFSVIVFLMFSQSFSQIQNFYLENKPKDGGVYTEGTTGRFYRINPIYSVTNQTDNDVVSLVFSGLVKRKDGKYLPDLAEKWSVSEDRKIYEFILKKGVKWHDGKPFGADDVVFTINNIQNPDVKSPLFETWKGVKIERINGGVKFTLTEPSNSFLDNTVFRVIPKHILESVPPMNLQTVDFNSSPVGTGPYKFIAMRRGSGKDTVALEKNDSYYGEKSHLDRIDFISYSREDDLIKDYKNRNIIGLGNPSTQLAEKVSNYRGAATYIYEIPRTVTEFFNLNNEFMKDKNFRSALSYLADRKKIIYEATSGDGIETFYPLSPRDVGYSSKIEKRTYNPKMAKEILEKNGYILEKEKRIYQGKEVILRIVTGENPELKKTAEILENDLKNLGIKTSIVYAPMATLQKEYIRSRNFDILVIGQNFGINPDLYGVWHSSQIADPGINLTGFKDRMMDKYLEQVRKTTDQAEIQAKLEEVQKVIAAEVPAVFLYSSEYLFSAFSKLKGVDPGRISQPDDRFADIADWYMLYDKVMIDSK